jgi:hypothetical protein
MSYGNTLEKSKAAVRFIKTIKSSPTVVVPLLYPSGLPSVAKEDIIFCYLSSNIKRQFVNCLYVKNIS